MIRSPILVAMSFVIFAGSSAYSQQYRNFEVQPDGTGGYYGTYGNQNFEVRPGAGQAGHIGGRRPNVTERLSLRPGSVGATQRSCIVDGNGFAVCR